MSLVDKLKKNYRKYVRVPTNITNIFQPLDLTFNKSTKAFMKRKFIEWYSLQVTKQLNSGKKL